MGSSAPYLIDRGDVQNSGNSRRAGEDRGLGRVVAIRSNANERLLLSDASNASNGRNEGAKPTLSKSCVSTPRIFRAWTAQSSGTTQPPVQHLGLEAGHLFENTSVQPAHALPAEPDELAAHLLRLVEAAAGIASLVDAEEALNRRANETC